MTEKYAQPNLVSDLVASFAQQLPNHAQSISVLDLGVGNGRHASYLSQLGHDVVGVGLHDDEIAEAKQCMLPEAPYSLVQADIRKLAFRRKFGAVLINEVLHMMPKAEASATMQFARDMTCYGGFNVISGYLTLPEDNYHGQYFEAGELKSIYRKAGWSILSYAEVWAPTQQFQGDTLINSKAKLIAVR